MDLEKLTDIQLFSATENRIRLGDLWQDQTVVLVFVRYFGCIFCREQVAEIASILPEIQKFNARLVIVGIGNTQDARTFLEENPIDATLLVDPFRHAYNAAGLHYGWRTVFNRASLKHLKRARAKGLKQGKQKGDKYQQGGVFVIAPGNRELFSYISREAGDHPNLQLILATLYANQ